MRGKCPIWLLSILVVSCGDPAGPTVTGISGTYQASTFTTDEAGATIDQLALGATITLVLNPDNSTTGRLFVPNGAEDGSDFDADLSGTWSLTGTDVSLDHPTDTFMRDMAFMVLDDELSGEDVFGGVTIRVVLTKPLGGLNRLSGFARPDVSTRLRPGYTR